jgi:hypothetical protein
LFHQLGGEERRRALISARSRRSNALPMPNRLPISTQKQRHQRHPPGGIWKSSASLPS